MRRHFLRLSPVARIALGLVGLLISLLMAVDLVFGLLPDTPAFPTLEVHDPEKFFADAANGHYREEHGILTSSDAHRLADMAEAKRFLELPEPGFAALRAAILKGNV